MTRAIGRRVFVALAAALPAPAWAQTYPSQTIRFVVPFGAGSASDNIGRLIADELQKALGATVIIDNRPGASGFIGTSLAVKAPPDGYTLVVDASATHSVNPWLFQEVPYDPIKDFTHIARLVQLPQIVVASLDVPGESLKELVEYGRANPGKLTFGYGTPTSRVGSVLLTSLGKFEALDVPYKTPSAALLAVVSGEVKFMVADLSTALPQIKAGKVKGLAISTAKRVDVLPDVPTMSEVGYGGFDTVLWIGLSGPASMPKAVVDRLSEAVVGIMSKHDVQEKIVAMGMEAAPSSSAEFQHFVEEQLEVWGRRIKAAGITPE
jgi:tripartite-type tricarboxylate transporter receptor subunit TctC